MFSKMKKRYQNYVTFGSSEVYLQKNRTLTKGMKIEDF